MNGSRHGSNGTNGSCETGPIEWNEIKVLDGDDALLQLSLSETENHVLGTTALGFCVWNATEFENKKNNAPRIDLKLPTGVRNISVRVLQSNSIILSKNDEFAVAGVRSEWQIFLFRH